jgi:hypothetical protein
VELVERLAEPLGPLDRVEHVDLGDADALRRGGRLKQRAELAPDRVRVRVRLVVRVQLVVPAGDLLVEVALAQRRRVVAQLGVLADEQRDVDAEAVDAAQEPEARDVEHRLAHLGVAPVQVRHLLEEDVQPVLLRALVPRPRRTAPDRDPVVRRPAARRGVAPDVPVAPRVVARRARGGEPRVVARRVVGHVVDDHLQPELVRARHQRVEVGERPEQRVDVGVVGDVVAEVAHRRAVERRQPDRVDAEPREVPQPRRDPGEIADPVAVRVGERARVDLVDDGGLPPGAGLASFVRREAHSSSA